MGYNQRAVRITADWCSHQSCAGGCGRVADYGVPDGVTGYTWTDLRKGRAGDALGQVLEDHFTGWCSLCRPHRGRKAAGGGGGLTVGQAADLAVTAWVEQRTCVVCGRPAETALTADGEPSLAVLRAGEHANRRDAILADAVPFCHACLHRVTGAMGRQASSAAAVERRGLTPARLRAAIEGGPGEWPEPARSENELMRRLGYPEHGNGIRQMLRRLVAVYRESDPTFPATPNAVADLGKIPLQRRTR